MRITKNKRIFVVFVILLLSSFKSSPVFTQTLVILHSDGSTTDVELSTWPEVTFENDNVIIKSTILDLEFPKQDVLRFTYKSKSTDISRSKDSDNIVKDNGQLLFNGIKSPDMISKSQVEDNSFNLSLKSEMIFLCLIAP